MRRPLPLLAALALAALALPLPAAASTVASAKAPSTSREASQNASRELECDGAPPADWLDAEVGTLSFPAGGAALAEAVRSFFSSHDDGSSNMQPDRLQTAIHEGAAAIKPFVVAARRLLHRHPELMYEERITSQILQRLLTEMGITNYSTGWAKNIHSEDEENDGGGHGIVADLGTGGPPCVLLRADMDALPLDEKTPLPPDVLGEDNNTEGAFRSEHEGRMHACGHDAHMAMLLGATLMLKDLDFPGTIRIIFQPAEEGGAGAKRMAEEGVLELHPPPSHAFGMHVWPTLPSGAIGFRSGPMLGAADMFTLTIEGVGGHAAFPHLVKDPIVASAAAILNLQTLVSRGMNPLESGVVSITRFDGGDGAFNVIPDRAVLKGTIRALSDEALLQLREGLVHIVSTTAQAHGCQLAEAEFSKDHYPVTYNNDELYPFAAEVAGLVAEGGKHTPVDPTMGAEDFAFLAGGVPSAFFFLGQGGKPAEDGDETHEDHHAGTGCGKCGRVPTNLGLHHPEFNLDENVLPRGVELFVNLALRSLRDLASKA
ncbi:hypothetical protein ACHAXT_008971 [Thalassiosira profunda]